MEKEKTNDNKSKISRWKELMSQRKGTLEEQLKILEDQEKLLAILNEQYKNDKEAEIICPMDGIVHNLSVMSPETQKELIPILVKLNARVLKQVQHSVDNYKSFTN